jgi:HNH endonuclease
MSEPFAYPPAPLSRRHGPRGYADYHGYRPWLRDEFCFRCVYCLLREQWGQVRGGHAIDHFEAVAQNPARATEYDNLLYACLTCNTAKAARHVPDPTAALLSPNVWVSADGAIHANHPEAAKLIDLLGLDRPRAREYRTLWIGIIKLAAVHDPDLHRRLMGFPDDLPDLARLRPPRGNARLEGVNRCFFAQKQRGTLTGTY